MLTSLLDAARQELVANLRPVGAPGPGQTRAPILARITLRGSSRTIQAARRRILRLIESLRSDGEEAEGPADLAGRDSERYTLTLVFCPCLPPVADE
jgi:hypothetical protein